MMRHLALQSRFCAGALALACSLLAGCAGPGARQQSTLARTPGPAKGPLLYLLASPHSRLHVEVDAVEGCEPDDQALQQLEAFLAAHCSKPDGIHVVRSDVIPRNTARKRSPRTLAREYIDGPERTNGPAPAFMYVLYYAGPMGRKPPHAETSPYPAIYLNTRFSLGFELNAILLHEAGHLLGLGHCRNRGCGMGNHYAYLRQLRWLPWVKHGDFCSKCVAELREAAAQPPMKNLRYIGPVLARSESSYHVISLPDRVAIVAGNLTEQDCEHHLTEVRRQPDEFRLFFQTRQEALDPRARAETILERLRNDPSNLVRQHGPRLFLQSCLNAYGAARQDSNSVALLRRAVLLDPRDDWSHNALAWIKATSPDAAVRDGKQAVSAGLRACELTRWRNRACVDTLAAAYAEAGDFDNAVKMQELALRTGKASEAQREEMRARLDLYKQSERYRTGEQQKHDPSR